jgi:hypothetical protein
MIGDIYKKSSGYSVIKMKVVPVHKKTGYKGYFYKKSGTWVVVPKSIPHHNTKMAANQKLKKSLVHKKSSGYSVIKMKIVPVHRKTGYKGYYYKKSGKWLSVPKSIPHHNTKMAANQKLRTIKNKSRKKTLKID